MMRIIDALGALQDDLNILAVFMPLIKRWLLQRRFIDSMTRRIVNCHPLPH